MPYKLCPSCGQSSYSASDRGVWKCPHCEKDITFVQSTFKQPNDTTKIMTSQLKLVKNSR